MNSEVNKEWAVTHVSRDIAAFTLAKFLRPLSYAA